MRQKICILGGVLYIDKNNFFLDIIKYKLFKFINKFYQRYFINDLKDFQKLE